MPSPEAFDLKSRYAQAMALLNVGQTGQALAVFLSILQARPNTAEAHFQIARILLQGFQPARALPHAVAATRLKPGEPAVWQVRAEAVALAPDLAAEESLRNDLARAPLEPAARVALQDRIAGPRPRALTGASAELRQGLDQLLGLMRAGRPAQAVPVARGLIARHPRTAELSNILGGALAQTGEVEAALAAFRRAVTIDPGYAEAWDNLGRTLLDLGRLDEARAALARAVTAAPALVTALANLALACTRLGEPRTALPLAEKAVRIAPRHALALVALGTARTRLKDYAGAAEVLGRAGALDPTLLDAQAMLGLALARLGRDDQAMAAYDAVLAQAPDHAFALGGKAALLQTLGRFDEAAPLFRRTFELDPTVGENYRLFSASHKMTPDDPLLAQMRDLLARPDLRDTDRIDLGFALAKGLEDLKDWRGSMAVLHEANARMRRQWPYDIATRQRDVAAVLAAMAGFDGAAAPLPGATDHAPIFVTGMPRSGTTLVEQIIASHSQVTGGGELGLAVQAAVKLLRAPDGGLRPLADLTAEEITGLGHAYAAEMQARFPGATRITDKSIQTYLYMGLIAQALPQARFVVVRRDPRDNLLSIYRNKFPDGTHLYAYDLRDLGLYYQGFVQAVDFWTARLRGRVHQVQYEDLVSDPENQTRRLIAACGLPWEDACLNHHQTERRVETLSVYQVRQPIYASSTRAWERYGDMVQDLLDTLGDQA
ncbi:MAG: sulfotransferase [Rhodobacterales bacterium]|nr:sulfotransferase [Rhodobacterales bacterium]